MSGGSTISRELGACAQTFVCGAADDAMLGPGVAPAIHANALNKTNQAKGDRFTS